MRSDDKSKDDVSPPSGYGNKDEPKADPKPAAAAAPPAAPVVPVTDAEMARYVYLRDKPNRTDVEEVEFDALDARIPNKPPVLEPLTPAEIGKLAEQRADPKQQPDPQLVAREGVVQPLEVLPPDASLVPQAEQDALGHIAAIVAAVVNAVPTLHNQTPRVIAMQEAIGRIVYNTPPPTPPVMTR